MGGRYSRHKQKKERKQINPDSLYLSTWQQIPDNFLPIVDHQLRKKISCLTLSLSLSPSCFFLGNKLCKWIVMPVSSAVSSGWGGSGWLNAAGILICMSFMYIDSYFLGSRNPQWFASGKGRTLYINTPPHPHWTSCGASCFVPCMIHVLNQIMIHVLMYLRRTKKFDMICKSLKGFETTTTSK